MEAPLYDLTLLDLTSNTKTWPMNKVFMPSSSKLSIQIKIDIGHKSLPIDIGPYSRHRISIWSCLQINRPWCFFVFFCFKKKHFSKYIVSENNPFSWKWLYDDCLMTTWWQLDDENTIAWWLPHDSNQKFHMDNFKLIYRTVFFRFSEINKSWFWVLSKKNFF